MLDLLKSLLSQFNFYYIPAALICITVHECCHGYIAYKLGDPTARLAGRLTLNPIRHIDPVGFLLLVVAGFGWARPVPVDTRYFKKPKRDMALTALAGPVSNFALAFVMMILLGAVTYLLPTGAAVDVIHNLILYTAVLSIGLGVFNLIPVSPLDGSKILFSVLPDNVYYKILRYERYGFILLIMLLYSGWINGPLRAVQDWTVQALWTAAAFPFRLLTGQF